MWVSAAHIPGTQNTEVDCFSRNFNETIQWKLSTHLFQKISNMFGNPTLDLFAFRQNRSNCSYTQMAHTTLVPQPLEKSDEKYDYHTISKEFGTTPGSTKRLATTPKALPTSKTSSMHHYVSQHAKNICIIRNAGKNIVQRKT